MLLLRGARGAAVSAAAAGSRRLAAATAVTTTAAAAASRLRRQGSVGAPWQRRAFGASRRLQVVKPVLLADIGEGIVECEIIQWFVQPGARVEEFAPLCEVQSDKASVEITSRFAGVVQKLHYEAGDMAKVGQPFVDIDMVEEGGPVEGGPVEGPAAEGPAVVVPAADPSPSSPGPASAPPSSAPPASPPKFWGSSLATPAVRHLSKQLRVDVAQVAGTGKDGRVTKEDLHRFVAETREGPPAAAEDGADADAPQEETAVPLSGTPLQMFKAMTKSLAIPHFLYADEFDFTQLHDLRQRVNAANAAAGGPLGDADDLPKLSYLPFVVKALSVALGRYPILNARVDVGGMAGGGTGGKPSVVYRRQHNIGVAMDTPGGLVVPVVRNVQARSVLSVAAELARLQHKARAGQLAPADVQGGTVTVSNIGSVGGTYLSPVVVEREVAIVGLGRLRTVPAFADEAAAAAGTAGGGGGGIVAKKVCHVSISADHRVVDGATVARAAEVLRQCLEQPDTMVVRLR